MGELMFFPIHFRIYFWAIYLQVGTTFKCERHTDWTQLVSILIQESKSMKYNPMSSLKGSL